MRTCPQCLSLRTVKNGRIHNGKQRFKCRECGRQFVEHPRNQVIDPKTRQLIDRLLLEHISPSVIARALNISEQWLQNYINNRYTQIPQKIPANSKTRSQQSI